MGLQRLMKKYDAESLAMISEESMIPLCEKYGVMWCMHENLPIGRKKNHGLKHALKLEWDYVIELGSDDLIKDELIELYRPHFGERDFLLTDSIAFINSRTGACRYVQSRSHYGLGRCLGRKVIEQTEVYSDKINQGIDKHVLFHLTLKGFSPKFIHTERPLTIDIKSDVNIWKYSSSVGRKISFQEVVEGLGADEIEAIESLRYATVA